MNISAMYGDFPASPLPAWLYVGAVVWDHQDRWKEQRQLRVRRIKRSRFHRSGWQVTLQKLEPPYWGWGREVDAGLLREVQDHERLPGVQGYGPRPQESVDAGTFGRGDQASSREWCSPGDSRCHAGLPNRCLVHVPIMRWEEG